MGPQSSLASTRKVMSFPFSDTPVTVAVARTVMPTGVGARWLDWMSTPTVPLPSGRSGCTQSMAACSIMAIINGVPNTSRPPEPMARAVISGVTTCSMV